MAAITESAEELGFEEKQRKRPKQCFQDMILLFLSQRDKTYGKSVIYPLLPSAFDKRSYVFKFPVV